jgi:hypothetical protein
MVPDSRKKLDQKRGSVMKEKRGWVLLLVGALALTGCEKKLYHAQVQMTIDGKPHHYQTAQVQMDEKDDRLSFYLLRKKETDKNKNKPYLILRYYLGNPVGKFWLRYNKPGMKHHGYLERFECYVPAAKPYVIYSEDVELPAKDPVYFRLYESGRFRFQLKGAPHSFTVEGLGKEEEKWKEVARSTTQTFGAVDAKLKEGRYRMKWAAGGAGKATVQVTRRPLLRNDKEWKKGRGSFGEKSCHVKIKRLGEHFYKLTYDAILTHSRKDKKRSAEKKKKKTRRLEVRVKGMALVKDTSLTAQDKKHLTSSSSHPSSRPATSRPATSRPAPRKTTTPAADKKSTPPAPAPQTRQEK